MLSKCYYKVLTISKRKKKEMKKRRPYLKLRTNKYSMQLQWEIE